MKRAFDENVPRVKPRVRFGVNSEASTDVSGETTVVETARETTTVEAAPARAEAHTSAIGESAADVHAAVSSAAEAVLSEVEDDALEERSTVQSRPAAASPATPSSAAPVAEAPRARVPAQAQADDASDQRRRKLRSRLWALQNPTPVLDATSPKAADAVVAAAEGLTRELSEARSQVGRLEHELSRARADLSRAVAEAEAERQRSSAQSGQIAEARGLLANLETELSVVEEERDEVLAEVRSLREADGARRDSLAALSRELDETRRALSEARAEQAEIVRELETGDAEIARLSHDVRRLEGEKSRFLQELTEMSSAKGELLDSRRTIERVHQLLAVAAAPKKR
jgi:DNA repair exonuclease SbcCD ATPase subunit